MIPSSIIQITTSLTQFGRSFVIDLCSVDFSPSWKNVSTSMYTWDSTEKNPIQSGISARNVNV